MRSPFNVIISCAMFVAIVSCKSTDNPLVPAPTVALSIKAQSPISVTLQIVADSSSVTDTDRFVLLRGSSATLLPDTVFVGTSAAATFTVFDSNKGHWLTPGGGYYYQSVEIRSGTEYARSTAVPAVLGIGEYLPTQPGSVWVYSGYITDSITGAKKPGSDYVSIDSLIGQISYQGYADVSVILHSRLLPGKIVSDSMFVRKDNVSGHYWKWSPYGFSGLPMWLDIFRLESTGVYTIHDTTEPGPGNAPVHEVVIGQVYPTAPVTIPMGTLSARKGDINVAIEAAGGLVRDTIPGLTIHLSPGFGIVRSVNASFLAKHNGLFKLPRSEGSVEELQTIRIKY